MLYIPDAVWAEVVEASRVPESDILTLGNIQRPALSETEVSHFAQEHSLQICTLVSANVFCCVNR